MTSYSETSDSNDLIGDVHGCLDELLALLVKLRYSIAWQPDGSAHVTPPRSRKVVFLGDLVNRGPAIAGVLRLVMGMVRSGDALCVAGNHDVMLARKLRDLPVEKEEHLVESLRQLQSEPEAFLREIGEFVDALPRRLSLDGSRLILAHAGLPEEYHGVDSPEADDFAVNGRRILDETGQLVRYRWADDYHGTATVVYGHYSQERAVWTNGTICIDTGCVYGGRLTALRYPERELVSVLADRVYFEGRRSAEFRSAALQPAEV
jgi:Calcineurin-like phosphoesterase